MLNNIELRVKRGIKWGVKRGQRVIASPIIISSHPPPHPNARFPQMPATYILNIKPIPDISSQEDCKLFSATYILSNKKLRIKKMEGSPFSNLISLLRLMAKA